MIKHIMITHYDKDNFAELYNQHIADDWQAIGDWQVTVCHVQEEGVEYMYHQLMEKNNKDTPPSNGQRPQHEDEHYAKDVCESCGGNTGNYHYCGECGSEVDSTNDDKCATCGDDLIRFECSCGGNKQ